LLLGLGEGAGAIEVPCDEGDIPDSGDAVAVQITEDRSLLGGDAKAKAPENSGQKKVAAGDISTH